MHAVKIIGVAIIATLALGVAMASSALATEFETSKGEKAFGKALNTQVFKTGTGFGSVECTGLSILNTLIKEGRHPSLELSITYTSCTAAGAAATVTLADYTFFASPAKVSLLKVNVLIDVPTLKCSIVVFFGQTFENAGEVTYTNGTGGTGKAAVGTVEVAANIKNISSEVTESGSFLCGKAGEKSTAGTYTGKSEAGIEGGTAAIN